MFTAVSIAVWSSPQAMCLASWLCNVISSVGRLVSGEEWGREMREEGRHNTGNSKWERERRKEGERKKEEEGKGKKRERERKKERGEGGGHFMTAQQY